MSEIVTLKYTGATPGADANTYTLFNSYSAGYPANFANHAGLHTFHYDIENDQTGTVNGYKSTNGTTWIQFYTMPVAASSATGTNNDVVLVEGYRHFKFEWVNGGSAQGTWVVDMDLSTKRAML